MHTMANGKTDQYSTLESAGQMNIGVETLSLSNMDAELLRIMANIPTKQNTTLVRVIARRKSMFANGLTMSPP